MKRRRKRRQKRRKEKGYMPKGGRECGVAEKRKRRR